MQKSEICFREENKLHPYLFVLSNASELVWFPLKWDVLKRLKRQTCTFKRSKMAANGGGTGPRKQILFCGSLFMQSV